MFLSTYLRRTLTKNPLPIHLLKQSTHNFVQKVEVTLAEMACVSLSIRMPRSESFSLFQSNVLFLNARSFILKNSSL